MISKRLIDARRRRKIPRQFNWVDHRLVRGGYLQRCSHPALALYLFLLTVGDADGLSYYSSRSLCRELNMAPELLARARGELIHAGLLAFRAPLYQVLGLDEPAAPAAEIPSAAGLGEPVDFVRVLQSILAEGGSPR